MTQEDKAKRYDEALKMAKSKIKNDKDHILYEDDIIEIFPELKESEDEKVRKWLITQLELKSDVNNPRDLELMILKSIDWLEKQGEKTPKFKVGDIVQYITDSTDRRKIEEIDTLCNMYHTDSSPIMFEIEDEWNAVLNSENVEQKTDNVEPKFHEGDWIISYPNGTVAHVNDIKKDIYGTLRYYIEFLNGSKSDPMPCFVDSKYHLWTINDAKDGDVLVASDGSIFLFAGVVDCACKYYVVLTSVNDVKINREVKGGYWETSRAVHPATKEQRDLLFSKMKEAGYEWNADKKELKKIEQNPCTFIPKFHVGDKLISTKNPRLTYKVLEVGHINELGNKEYKVEIFTDGKAQNPHNIYNIECCKVDEWANLIEYKPSWNEEDIFKVQRICKYLNEAKKYYADVTEVRECIDWLKSLEDRYTWKPSDKQVEALAWLEKQGKQKLDWSEEDENLLNRLIGVLDGTNKEDYHEAWEEKFLPWLKHLS